MNIVVVGGGVASCFFSILMKRKYKDASITIIESASKLLKRVLVSGNGRANFFNSNFLSDDIYKYVYPYNEYRRLLNKEDAKEVLSFLKDELHFEFFEDDEKRMYPFANTSESLYQVLVNEISRLKIKVELNSKVDDIDYKNKVVSYNGKTVKYDLVYIGVGGYSYDREFNSNSSFLKPFVKEKYSPSLCPIITKEKIPSYLVGKRVKCLISLFKNDIEIYKEQGEVIFKKDGLSGIAIFNVSSYVNNEDRYVIKLDLSQNGYKKIAVDLAHLDGYFPSYIVKYIKERKIKDVTDIAFNFKGKYDYKDSQLTSGGVAVNKLNKDFSYATNKEVLFGGEVISLHGRCGGYNIGLALLEAYKSYKLLSTFKSKL